MTEAPRDALRRATERNAIHHQDGLAEWSKALASGASPQGRGLEPHSRHLDDGIWGKQLGAFAQRRHAEAHVV